MTILNPFKIQLHVYTLNGVEKVLHKNQITNTLASKFKTAHYQTLGCREQAQKFLVTYLDFVRLFYREETVSITNCQVTSIYAEQLHLSKAYLVLSSYCSFKAKVSLLRSFQDFPLQQRGSPQIVSRYILSVNLSFTSLCPHKCSAQHCRRTSIPQKYLLNGFMCEQVFSLRRPPKESTLLNVTFTYALMEEISPLKSGIFMKIQSKFQKKNNGNSL